MIEQCPHGIHPAQCPDCASWYHRIKDLELNELHRFTHHRDNHNQYCPEPKCNSHWLICIGDHFGGGSHYWSLVCPECGMRYTYDTYLFTLKEWPWDTDRNIKRKSMPIPSENFVYREGHIIKRSKKKKKQQK